MDQRMRRNVCRMSFVALAALPTFAVVVWAGAARWPGGVARSERRLADELGLSVSLENATDPRPGVKRFEGLRLAEPETGREVLRLRSLDVVRRSDATSLVASQGELFAEQLPLLWQLITERLRTEHVADRPGLRLAISGLTIHGALQGQTLASLVGEIERTAAGARGSLRFQLAAESVGEPIRITIERRASSERVSTRWELHTANRPLPLAPLAELVPALAHLGPRAKFQGALWVEQTGDEWQGELTGSATDVDLDALVTEQFPHKLSGMAQVRIEKAQLRGGRLVAAVMSIKAGPGVIEDSLIRAGVEHAGIRRPAPQDTSGRFAAYDQLALAIQLEPGRMTLRGECDGAGPGAVLVSRGAVLLKEPEKPAANALGLVRMMLPRGDLQVPASAETRWLLDGIPLPEARSPGDGATPKARVRLDNE